MNNLYQRVGYFGKPEQWKRGFDLAEHELTKVIESKDAEIARLRTQAVADAVRIAELERAQTWLPIDESTPYEKKILTKWVGDEHRPPVVLVNTRNNSVGIGRKDGFWFSLPDQTPTLWCNLPESTK